MSDERRDPVEIVELVLMTSGSAKGYAHAVVTRLRAAGLLRDEAREARMRDALTRIEALVPCIQRAAGMTRASLERLVEAIGAEARAALEDKR